MFYVLIFSLLAVVLVVGGLTTMCRRRRNLEFEEEHVSQVMPAVAIGRLSEAESQHDRRKRH